MRFAALVALGVLVVLPADALQQRQYALLTPTCDNDGRCTTFHATAPMTATYDSRREIKTTAPMPAARPQSRPLDANGNGTGGLVISRKTGARAHVGVAHAARFQAYIDELENNHGARVLFMGGIRPGSCSPSSEHPCGKALDVCQLRRGVVDPRCKLPARAELGRIAASHGLFEGGRGAIPTMAMRRSTRHGPAGNRATASRGKKRSNKSNWRTPGRLQLAV